MADEGLNEYELERKRRIEENRRVLGLTILSNPQFSALQNAKPVVSPAQRKARKAQENIPPEATRKSQRQRAPVDYRADLKLYLYEERDPKTIKRGRGAKGGSKRDNQNVLYNSPEAGMAALEAAYELAKSLENPCGVKGMTTSQVSGGFWMQLPLRFSSAMGFEETTAIQLKHGDYVKDCVFLVKRDTNGRKSGGKGLSGGWRGFALHQKLHPDDVVVFEKLGPKEVYVHIVRAQSFDDQPAKRLESDTLEEEAEGEQDAAQDDENVLDEEQDEENVVDDEEDEENVVDEEEDEENSSDEEQDEDGSADGHDDGDCSGDITEPSKSTADKTARASGEAGTGNKRRQTAGGDDGDEEDGRKGKKPKGAKATSPAPSTSRPRASKRSNAGRGRGRSKESVDADVDEPEGTSRKGTRGRGRGKKNESKKRAAAQSTSRGGGGGKRGKGNSQSVHTQLVKHQLVGAAVRKPFADGQLYDGWVKEYLEDVDWYTLEYTDKDREDVYLSDVQAYMLTGAQLVGATVRKEVGNTKIWGKVCGFDEDEAEYTVDYDDATQEDLEFVDLLKVLWQGRPEEDEQEDEQGGGSDAEDEPDSKDVMGFDTDESD